MKLIWNFAIIYDIKIAYRSWSPTYEAPQRICLLKVSHASSLFVECSLPINRDVYPKLKSHFSLVFFWSEARFCVTPVDIAESLYTFESWEKSKVKISWKYSVFCVAFQISIFYQINIDLKHSKILMWACLWYYLYEFSANTTKKVSKKSWSIVYF